MINPNNPPIKIVVNNTKVRQVLLITFLFLVYTLNTNPKAIAPLIIPEIKIINYS